MGDSTTINVSAVPPCGRKGDCVSQENNLPFRLTKRQRSVFQKVPKRYARKGAEFKLRFARYFPAPEVTQLATRVIKLYNIKFTFATHNNLKGENLSPNYLKLAICECKRWGKVENLLLFDKIYAKMTT